MTRVLYWTAQLHPLDSSRFPSHRAWITTTDMIQFSWLLTYTDSYSALRRGVKSTPKCLKGWALRKNLIVFHLWVMFDRTFFQSNCFSLVSNMWSREKCKGAFHHLMPWSWTCELYMNYTWKRIIHVRKSKNSMNSVRNHI